MVSGQHDAGQEKARRFAVMITPVANRPMPERLAVAGRPPPQVLKSAIMAATE